MTHVFREGNRISNLFANWAHPCEVGSQTLDQPRTGCDKLLLEDMQRDSWLRTVDVR